MQSQAAKIQLLHKMVEIYSPTGHEHGIASFLVDQMAKLGFRSYIDEVGNAIGEYGSKPPTILLCGHMDTVPGKLPVRLEEDKLFGRGAVDAKSALAAMICAGATLTKENFPGSLIVVGAVDEEGNGNGVKKLIRKGVHADYAIFGEPSGVDNITIAYKGSLHLKLTIKTCTGHSAASWLFNNAIEEAFSLWGDFQRIRFPEERSASKFYSITSSITEIQGGGPSSMVPSNCELHIDFRLPPSVPSQRLFGEIMHRVESYHLSQPDVNVKIDVEDKTEPYEADLNSVLVRGLSWGIRDVRKKPATLTRKTGTGDMNLFGGALEIPTVTYGAGDSKLDHTINEYIELSEYLESIDILHMGLKRTLQLHSRTL